ncbi:putative protease [Paenibacillus sp. UNCCL117]|uniref:peptidase U32 family protein n=1 Tax=unclassified Paenibacillus TaxID=185978 RepID=UPI00088354B4|nr:MULTISPECIES: peptidase U32 family protein [unclassified Paenibacillus]SDD01053.1 putative protease [Paenibacillus sp. cl123]SFW32745.1 putative protease [Paenibacillus sp. UNCCL117]
MTTKPELLIAAGTPEEAKRYVEAGADAIVVGEHRFGLRLPGEITVSELEKLAPWLRERGVKLYAAVNNLFSNEQLEELQAYLKELHRLQVDALVFGDPAVLIAAREAAPGIGLHWNAEMTSTNYATAKYWGTKGATRMVLARELNLEETLEIKRLLPDMEVQVQVHGITNIYHSKRSLLTNYNNHQGQSRVLTSDEVLKACVDQGLFLIEQERQNERYPVYEDMNGTHIMSSDDICMLDSLHELMEGGIDSLKIESLLKPVAYNETVLRSYRRAIDAYTADPAGYAFDESLLDAIRELQDPRRELSYGFFFKEQVY